MIISPAFNYSQVGFFCLNTQTSIAVTSAGVEPGRAGQFLFSAIPRNKPDQKLGGEEKKKSPKWKAGWGRANQCFNSSATAAQRICRLITKDTVSQKNDEDFTHC